MRIIDRQEKSKEQEYQQCLNKKEYSYLYDDTSVQWS